ncbi:MAG: sulfotransferase [Elusimicrobia bacterium]|nr:sulfotransferase [Elusimicrobiota bacterium]
MPADKNMDFKDRGVIITGHARTGTTLLVSLLDGHPGLMVIPVESKFFSAIESGDFYRYIYDIRCFSRFRQGEVIRGGYEPEIKYEDITAEFEKNNAGYGYKNRFIAVLKAFYRFYGNDNAEMWVEKTPAHWLYWPLLKTWFKGLKMVHMYRDPRDVFASWSKRNPGADAASFCGRFMKIYDTVEEYKRHTEDIVTVRYEDLVADTGAVMKRICGFLGIDYSDSMKKPTVMGREFGSNSSHFDGVRGISNRSVGIYKSALPGSLAETVEKLTRRFMDNEGYSDPERPRKHAGRNIRGLVLGRFPVLLSAGLFLRGRISFFRNLFVRRPV